MAGGWCGKAGGSLIRRCVESWARATCMGKVYRPGWGGRAGAGPAPLFHSQKRLQRMIYLRWQLLIT